MPKTIDISEVPSAYDFEDALHENFKNNAVPFTELCAHPITAKIVDRLLSPYHLVHNDDASEPLTLLRVRFRYGDLAVIRDESFPVGQVILR